MVVRRFVVVVNKISDIYETYQTRVEVGKCCTPCPALDLKTLDSQESGHKFGQSVQIIAPLKKPIGVINIDIDIDTMSMFQKSGQNPHDNEARREL